MEPKKEFIQELVKRAGKEVLKYFGKSKIKETKTSSIDVLTEADLISEKLIKDAIKKEYPDHGIIAEESGIENEDKEYVWVIDPIDGTDNFVHSNPLFGVIIGVMKNKEMLMSAIYLPVMDELFFAKKGEGAFLNGERIKCSNISTIDGSRFILNGWFDREVFEYNCMILKDAKDKESVCSSFGCAAVVFAYLASGRKDWHITRNFTLWDIGVPSLLCQEAGLDVKFIDGEDFNLFKKGIVVFANPKLNENIRSMLK